MGFILQLQSLGFKELSSSIPGRPMVKGTTDRPQDKTGHYLGYYTRLFLLASKYFPFKLRRLVWGDPHSERR